MSPGKKRQRAERIRRVVDYLYATGRTEWAHRWAREFHSLANDLLLNHSINVYG